jgi:hypothetical protein
MLAASWRIVVWSFAVGAICFAAGFFGPMILAPGANQGPLLGILITGPLGVLAGLLVGLWRELRGHRAGPLDVLSSYWPRSIDRDAARVTFRPVAAIGAVILAVYSVAGLRRGEGRGAAAGIVVAAAIMSFAITGRAPAWFRR